MVIRSRLYGRGVFWALKADLRMSRKLDQAVFQPDFAPLFTYRYHGYETTTADEFRFETCDHRVGADIV